MAERRTQSKRPPNRSPATSAAAVASATTAAGAADCTGSDSADAHCVLTIKAVPNAPQSEVVGWLGDALKVRLKSPPVDGKANAELCRYLAEMLALPKSAVALATGSASREKRLRINGLTLAQLRERF